MARKQKHCVDYFPHDCHLTKILRIVTKKFGNDGYAFYYRLRELLGRTDNYNYPLKEKIDWFDFLSEMDIEQEQALEIIELFLDVGELDKELWEEEKRLWSQNFVNSIASVYEKRSGELPDKYSFRDGNPHSRVGNPYFRVGNTQSKEKEIKVQQTKVEESVGTLTEDELLILQKKYPKVIVEDSYQSFTLHYAGEGRSFKNLPAAFEKWLIGDINFGKHKRQMTNEFVEWWCLNCDTTKNVEKNNSWLAKCDNCNEPMVSKFEYKHTKSAQNAPPNGG